MQLVRATRSAEATREENHSRVAKVDRSGRHSSRSTSKNDPGLVGLKRRTRRTIFFVLILLLRLFFRSRVAGLETSGVRAYLITPNHQSYVDPFVLAASAVPRSRTLFVGAVESSKPL